jgi:hypothetical protein
MHPMLAIPHQRVNLFVRDPIIFAAFVRAEVPFCGTFFFGPPLPFLSRQGIGASRSSFLFRLSSWQKRQSRSLFGRSTGGFRGRLAFFFCESRWRSQIWRSFR